MHLKNNLDSFRARQEIINVLVAGCALLILADGCSSEKFKDDVEAGNGQDRNGLTIAARRVEKGQISLGEDWAQKKILKGMDMYVLMPASDENVSLSALEREEGVAGVICDGENLFVWGIFKDRDIISHSVKDAERHYKRGDVCEIFLKPTGQNWYWEIWITPNGHKAAVLWILCKDGTKQAHKYYLLGMQVSTHIEGTLNRSNDIDKYWTFKLKIPISRLQFPVEVKGDRDIGIGDWRMLIARQNFTGKVDLNHRELSSYPQLRHANFHSYKEYAKLVFVKKRDKK